MNWRRYLTVEKIVPWILGGGAALAVQMKWQEEERKKLEADVDNSLTFSEKQAQQWNRRIVRDKDQLDIDSQRQTRFY